MTYRGMEARSANHSSNLNRINSINAKVARVCEAWPMHTLFVILESFI